MKSNVDSPKTPAGISKTLLTPCRRVGLSRKFNRKGPSPFISPLSRNQNSAEDIPTKKMKNGIDELTSSIPTQAETSSDALKANACISSPPHITSTPSRNVHVSKMKDLENNVTSLDNYCKSPQNKDKTVTKLARSNSKKMAKIDTQVERNDILTDSPKCDIEKCIKKKPNNLTKECIVLIQKKMLKNIKSKNEKNTQEIVNVEKDAISQTISDSDSDDLPLCGINKKYNIEDIKGFVDNKLIVKRKNNDISVPILKTNINQNRPLTERKHQILLDDDDFEIVKKRPIVKKTYNKVAKPSRAKSTGSITQNDIDEMTARIEMKKKLLIAKAMTKDTEELRSLIKKWQKGCQDALFELFDLMKQKCPDSQNMDYSDILKTLKIPPELVGYDVDNDCFITPDDSSIVLASVNT